jgi:hypothetical protein
MGWYTNWKARARVDQLHEKPLSAEDQRDVAKRARKRERKLSSEARPGRPDAVKHWFLPGAFVACRTLTPHRERPRRARWTGPHVATVTAW